jgi:FKBP-type peptidyl-prolyl cis-trans isomerase 2
MLKVVNGDEIEKSVVEYIQGSGAMLAGLEKVLDGLEKGAKKTGVIKAANAFGDPARQVNKPMTRKDFPEDLKLEVGAQFVAKGADNNQDVVLRIAGIDGDDVKVQLLHPLAEKDIEFDVEVLAVTDPAPPPLPMEALGASEADDAE